MVKIFALVANRGLLTTYVFLGRYYKLPAETIATRASASVKITDIDHVFNKPDIMNYSKRKLHKRAKLGTVVNYTLHLPGGPL